MLKILFVDNLDNLNNLNLDNLSRLGGGGGGRGPNLFLTYLENTLSVCAETDFS